MSPELAPAPKRTRIRNLYRTAARFIDGLRAQARTSTALKPLPGVSALHVDTLGTMPVEPGIASIRGWADTGEQVFPEGIVEVALDDEHDWVKLSDRVPVGDDTAVERNRRCGFRAALNTFLLDNGVHRLRLRVKTASGAVAASRQVQFRVNHVGPLAEEASRLLKAYPQAKRIWTDLIDSSEFPMTEAGQVAWFERPDAEEHIPDIVARHGLARSYEDHLRQFVREGYIVLDDFISRDHCERINRDLEAMIRSGVFRYKFKGQRIEKLFQHSRATHDLWAHPQILKVLSAIFDDMALPCQTLNFIHGSQQNVHQDVIHLTPFPPGFMCGVWVALEDIHPDAGPLVVYPGSHRMPRYYTSTLGFEKVRDPNEWGRLAAEYEPKLQELIEQTGIEPVLYTPKVGSVLIWHENLAHGGTPVRDDRRTRKSIVSHYFARGGLAFYDSQGTPAWTEPPAD